MITNRIRLKADVGSIKKGRVVDVFEGKGYWYVEDGKQKRTVIPTAHEVLLPKYVVKEKSGTYSIRKDYTVDGERLSFFVGGIKTLEETFDYSEVMKKYDNIIQKLMKRAKGNTEVVTVIQPSALELDELKKENEDLQASYEKEKGRLPKKVQSLSKEIKELLEYNDDLERINQERSEKEKEMKQIIDKLEKESGELKEQITKTKLESEFVRQVTKGQYYKDIGSKLDEILKVTHENSKGGIWSRLLGGK